MELVPAETFHNSFAMTSEPDVAILKCFQMDWTKIDQIRYEPGAAHEEVSSMLKDDKDSLQCWHFLNASFTIVSLEMFLVNSLNLR